jgi:hypothetical protein
VGNNSLLGLSVDSIHKGLCRSPITVSGGVEERFGELAAVLLDDVSPSPSLSSGA